MSLAHGAEIVKSAEVTHDAFLGGRLTIAQPRSGFRAGLDSVLLGAAITPVSGGVLDLGAGAGTAALVALCLNESATATLIESDPAMVALAVENLATNGLAARARVLGLDVTSPGRVRTAAGLPADHFAAVIANPPFFETGTAPAAKRAAARHMPAATLDLWVKTAAAHAAPGGEIVFIHVADRLAALLAAFDARFGALTVLPFVPREGEAAHRILVRGIKGSRGPLRLLASRALHAPASQAFLPEFEAIFRGEDRLHW